MSSSYNIPCSKHQLVVSIYLYSNTETSLAVSTLAVWCRIVWSRDVMSRDFSVPVLCNNINHGASFYWRLYVSENVWRYFSFVPFVSLRSNFERGWLGDEAWASRPTCQIFHRKRTSRPFCSTTCKNALKQCPSTLQNCQEHHVFCPKQRGRVLA